MNDEEGNEKDIQEAKRKIRETFDEIAQGIVDGQRSLTARMVRAYRIGAIDVTKADYLWAELGRVFEDARATYLAAIAQPAPKVSTKSRINL
jgi:hypothetical protein